MPPLFEATREVEMIARALPPGTQLLPSTGTTSSVRNVLELLPHVSILHLACHGLEDTTNPHLSGFHLSDGRLTLAEIIQQDTPHALFAFLSACESARGHSVHHPEQSIHLAAALLFAGFKSVVGTLWDMSDVDGPVVAGAVYRELFKGDVLDPRIIPYALDEAVQELRRQGAPAHRWATFVHIGA
jgi:CHAT domain-containing protein